MKKTILSLLCLLSLAASAADGKAMVSTTMDFLDIVMYSPVSRKFGYYPLEQYEKELKNLADAGIKKVYIRNCVGLTFYNTKVRAKYNRKNGGHFANAPDLASFVEKTCEMYDPVAETIRLCHKYGMEAWAWENYHEEVGSLYLATFPEGVRNYGFFPLCDPFYVKHPEYLAMIRPSRKYPSPEQAKKINDSIKGRRIGKIHAVSDLTRPYPLRIYKDNLNIYYSNDNLNWTLYDKDYSVKVTLINQRNALIISGLDIDAKYVKLAPTEIFSSNKKYSYIINDFTYGSRVFDTNGEPMPAQWGSTWGHQSKKNAAKDSLFLSFSIGNHAWDNDSIGIGFAVGIAQPYGQSYRRGMAELHIPAVMEFRLKAFAELAAYNFDGFCFSSRTHSVYGGGNPDLFGFNPEVREKFMKRYGQDIWDPNFKDLKKLQEFRAEALDEYLAGCKKIAGNRPIYADVPKTSEAARKYRPSGVWWNSFGSMPFNFEKWVKEGSVDGLIMHGWCDPAEFKALKEKYGIKISLFHKVKTHIKFPPAEREAHLKDILALDGLDEVELYESCLISDHPQHLKIIRSAVDHKDPVPGGNAAALKRVQEKVNAVKW